MIIKKKKTRRGGKARHPLQTQDAKMMSKDQEKRDLTHIKSFKCGNMGQFASKCPIKLEKKAQAIYER